MKAGLAAALEQLLFSGQWMSGSRASTYGLDVVGKITEKSDAGNPYLYTSPALHGQSNLGAIQQTAFKRIRRVDDGAFMV